MAVAAERKMLCCVFTCEHIVEAFCQERPTVTEQGGAIWTGLTAADGLLGELNPLLFLFSNH